MKIEATLILHSPVPAARELVSMRFSTPETAFRITTSLKGMEACEIGFPILEESRFRNAWLPEALFEYQDWGHV